jgi:xylulose-5-phosphate/fructose-6-phosphate phosphoketolase
MTSTHVNESQLRPAAPPLTSEDLHKIDAYWRACNYLCAGMIYLHDNPLLKEPLRPEHFKNRLLGHWGSDPGQTFAWAHLNRAIRKCNTTSFRVFSPDENASNRLQDIHEASLKTWMATIKPEDADGTDTAPDGRVMEMLSEHTLEGYLLTGRHGLFNTYESFVHIIDSMYNQHAKWLEKSKLELKWRAPISSLNLLISSLVWRQDHNGFTHQDPGFLDLVSNKSAEVTRIYLPPDANCLFSVADHCLRSEDYVNVIVSDKQPHLVYLDMDAAIIHCTKGIGIWEWASNDAGAEPDVVVASAGDILTQEALAAVAILRERVPDLKIRFVNVVDLYRLQPDTEHPHGLCDRDFDSLFTKDKPVIFNFHGYPWLIHKFTYRRTNHANIHVRGYKEEGNINTPLELAIRNQVDRFNLAIDVIDRVPNLQERGAHLKEWLKGQIIESISPIPKVRTSRKSGTGGGPPRNRRPARWEEHNERSDGSHHSLRS